MDRVRKKPRFFFCGLLLQHDRNQVLVCKPHKTWPVDMNPSQKRQERISHLSIKVSQKHKRFLETRFSDEWHLFGARLETENMENHKASSCWNTGQSLMERSAALSKWKHCSHQAARLKPGMQQQRYNTIEADEIALQEGLSLNHQICHIHSHTRYHLATHYFQDVK